MFCPKCGNEIKKGASFCNKCGYEVPSTGTNLSNRIHKEAKHFSFHKFIPSVKLQKICLSVIALLLTFSMSFGIVAQAISLNNNVAEVENKVYFDLNYPNSENFYLKVNYNTNLVTEPMIPQREGFQFVGWYSSLGYSPMFDFSQKITDDITLFAKWNDKSDTTDTDKDGLSDSLELSLGTDPNKWDTDGDTLSDWFELNYLNYNPLEQDSDGNGVFDTDEDADNDGLSNGEEMKLGTSPILSDSDMDGINDIDEINKYNTNPTTSDTDGDGASDGVEIELGYDPLIKNTTFTTTASLGRLSQDTPVVAEAVVTSNGKSAGTLIITEKDMSENRHMIDKSSDAYVGPAYDISMDGDFNTATLTFSYHYSIKNQYPNFEPCLYWFNETENQYEEVPNQVVDNSKIVAEVSHFSVYQILNKNELGGVNKSKIDSNKYSQFSETKDSNGDGLSDFYTALINDGIIQYNGSDFLFEVVDMYGTDCADWDGDGLKNGEEIKVANNNGTLSLEIISNPLLKDSDGDGFDDADEIKNLKSDPLKYTKNGQSALSQLKNVNSYEVSWRDNVARFFEFDEQSTVERFLENYFYDYSPINSIAKNTEKIDNLIKHKDGIEVVSQIAKTASNIYSIVEVCQTDFSKIGVDSKGVDQAHRAKQKASADKLSDAAKALKDARKSMLDSINDKKYTEMAKTALSVSKSVESLNEDIDTMTSGEMNVIEGLKELTSIAKTSIKAVASVIKIKNLNYGEKLLRTYKYQRLADRTKPASKNVTSYYFTLAVDVIEGAADLNEAITSYSKIEANIDAFNDALGILYDLSTTDGLNDCYRRAAKNVMKYVANASTDYTNEIINLHSKQILVTGSTIALDTLSLINPYAAICKAFLEGVELIGLNNMAECSIYMEIMNEMQKQCVAELNKLNIADDDNGEGTTFTYSSDEDRSVAELFMTHLAQSKILFEYYAFKYSYESGISSGIASITGGVSKEKGEEATKSLIKSVYDKINILQLGVSANLPYYDDFYNKEVLSTLNLKDTSDERDVVLVMDVSGSMGGTKIAETKTAASKFIDTVLSADASVSIVTYSDSATLCKDFSNDQSVLNDAVNSISANGGTNIEAGLKLASEQMYYSHAKKKIIVLMSDGEPNNGKVGDELVRYAESIKSRGIYLYTLGFFDNSSNRTEEQILMEKLSSEGCHYEVSNSNNLVFFFDDIANMIRGQQFIYVKIACPVEVSVSFNGETISSVMDGDEQRAMFGTLTKTLLSDNEEAKILRLKAENEYDIQIIGTGTGTMDYMVALMDVNGDYNDFRVFENVNIFDGTNISSTVNNSDSTQMIVDEDGDGETDYTCVAGQNQMGRKVVHTYVYLATYSALALGIVLSLLVIVATKKRKEIVEG